MMPYFGDDVYETYGVAIYGSREVKSRRRWPWLQKGETMESACYRMVREFFQKKPWSTSWECQRAIYPKFQNNVVRHVIQVMEERGELTTQTGKGPRGGKGYLVIETWQGLTPPNQLVKLQKGRFAKILKTLTEDEDREVDLIPLTTQLIGVIGTPDDLISSGVSFGQDDYTDGTTVSGPCPRSNVRGIVGVRLVGNDRCTKRRAKSCHQPAHQPKGRSGRSVQQDLERRLDANQRRRSRRAAERVGVTYWKAYNSEF